MTSVIEALQGPAFIVLTFGIPLACVVVGLVRIIRSHVAREWPEGISDWWLVAIGLTWLGVSFILFPLHP